MDPLDDSLPVPERDEGPLPPDKVLVEEGDMELAVPVRRGRPRKLADRQKLSEVLRLYFVEKLSMREVADLLGVSHMSVYRILSDPDVELLI